MATQPRDNLDFEEQRVRIVRAIEDVEKFAAESRKLNAEQLKLAAERAKLEGEAKVVTFATVFQGLIAVAALLGAGAAIAKLFFP